MIPLITSTLPSESCKNVRFSPSGGSIACQNQIETATLCEGCFRTTYCSKNCQMQAQEQHEWFECKALFSANVAGSEIASFKLELCALVNEHNLLDVLFNFADIKYIAASAKSLIREIKARKIFNEKTVESLFNKLTFSQKNNKDIILAIAERCGLILGFTPHFTGDKDIVLAVVKQMGGALQFAHENLQNNKEVVFAAVKQNPNAFQFASEALRNDREFILSLVKENGLVIGHVSQELYNDREFSLEAIEHGVKFLQLVQLVNPKFYDDREFILEAVKRNNFAIIFAREDFQKDKEIISACKDYELCMQIKSKVSSIKTD